MLPTVKEESSLSDESYLKQKDVDLNKQLHLFNSFENLVYTDKVNQLMPYSSCKSVYELFLMEVAFPDSSFQLLLKMYNMI